MKRIRLDKLTNERLVSLQKGMGIDPAWQHNLLTAPFLRQWAVYADAKMEGMGLPRHLRKGATTRILACNKMPDAYKYRRKSASAKLEYYATGWFLTSLQPIEVFPNEGGTTLYLTAEQVENIRQRVTHSYIL